MIQTTEVSITYKGDGVQTSFPYPYPYRNSDDIVGYIINDVGYEKRITNNFKYDKVSTIYQYPLAGDPLAAPYSIKLIRETPQQQNADLPEKLPFSLIEKSLDWIIMILQEIGGRCNSLWHIRNDCKLSETNARNSASAAAESEENAANSEENAANSEDMAKKWAMSPVSPDGVVDTNSPTGYTQSAKIWAALSKEYAGMSKFKLPIGYYNSVAEMKASETAIVGRPCVTLGYYEQNDGGGAVYIIRSKKENEVDDGGSVLFLDNGNVAELIIEGAVNVKQFGVKGDGVTDDAESIQTALNTLHDVVIPQGKYVIGKSLYFTGRYRDIYADSAYIKYTGSEFALVIEGVVSSTYHLGVIWSDTGNAIKITASYKKREQGKHYCQYMTIYFKEIWAKTYDIKFDIDVNPDDPHDATKNGWLNENRFYNGRLATTSSPNEMSYGVYADSKGHISYNKFYNVGLEAPRCGIYLANKCNSWVFSNCHWWDTTNMLTTEGECNGIVIETSEYLGNLNGKFNLSAHTNGRITCIDTTSMATQHIINNGNIIFKDGINKIDQALVNKYNQGSYGSEKGFLAFFHYHVPNGHTTWYLTVPSFINSDTGAYLYLDIYKNSTGNEYSGVIRGHYQNSSKELLTWFVSTGRIQRAD